MTGCPKQKELAFGTFLERGRSERSEIHQSNCMKLIYNQSECRKASSPFIESPFFLYSFSFRQQTIIIRKKAEERFATLDNTSGRFFVFLTELISPFF